jgi:hypothetical protein
MQPENLLVTEFQNLAVMFQDLIVRVPTQVVLLGPLDLVEEVVQAEEVVLVEAAVQVEEAAVHRAQVLHDTDRFQSLLKIQTITNKLVEN